MRQHIYKFLLILGAATVSAVLGALFATVIALISPEFISNLFSTESDGAVSYAAAVGMIWGLFIGAGAMAFVLCLTTLVLLFKPLAKKTDGEHATPNPASSGSSESR